MMLRMQEIQKTDLKAQKLRQYLEGSKKIDGILYYQYLLFVSEAIRTKITSRKHNNALADHFSIEKTRELIARK